MTSFQQYQDTPRVLTEEEEIKLKNDCEFLSEFKKIKLEKEAEKNWDLFYKRNTTNFFKDRHWTCREFQELCSDEALSGKVMLEVGCGVGNTIFPLIKEVPSLFIHACDFSRRAVQFVQEHDDYDSTKMNVFHCDVTQDDLTRNIAKESVEIITIIFVLSSITPQKMLDALYNVSKVLKQNGVILFRDYGLYDHAMLRFSKGHKISDHFYVRQDGTRAYYFTTEYLKTLFTEAGFETTTCDYVQRRTVNKKEGVDVPRIFVQGKFIKK